MHASARFRLPSGAVETLLAGDIIGRTWAAALQLDDPAVSEAHAMVSLRGEQLWLLALRRRLIVGGRPVESVVLQPGLVVGIAPNLSLVVEQISLPEAILGLEGPGLPAQALPGTCSLVRDPYPRLAAGASAEALAVFWLTEGQWRARAGDGRTRPLLPGDALELGGERWRATLIALDRAGRSHTCAGGDGPLRIVSRFDTVQLHRSSGPVVVIAGQMARVLAELISVQQPISWEALARPHWPHLSDREVLRRRWDGLLGRLRERLRESGVRGDLVASSGIGLVELVLREGDLVEDQA